MKTVKLLLFLLLFATINSEQEEIIISKTTSINSSIINNKKISDCSQSISGKIVSKTTNSPITGAVVSLIVDGDEINIVKTNSEGSYLLKLNCNTNYKIKVNALKYFEIITEFQTNSDNNLKTNKDFTLEKECYQVIKGNITNELTTESIDKVKISLYLDGDEVDSKLAENDGSYTFKVKCNSDYYIITNKLNFINDFYEFSSSANNNEIINHNFVLEPECVQTISGTILNKVTKEPLRAELFLYLNNIEVEKIRVNNDGKYFVKFQCTTNYKIVASKPNYTSDTYNFLTDYIANKQPDYYNLRKDLLLEPNECFQVVLGKVLEKGTNNIIPNAQVSLYYQNHEIKTFQTNTDGSYFFNIKCNLNYEVKASSEHVISQKIKYTASEIKDESRTQNLYLEKEKCNQIVNGTILDLKTKLPLNNSTVSILENNSEIKNITTDNSGNFSFKINCESNFKIVAKNPEYNSDEIEFDTDKSRDATISKTIELTPLDCNQIVNGTILDSKTKLPLNNSAVSILENNSEIKNITTDNSGNFSFKINCESNFKIVAKNPEYNSNEISFNSDKSRDATISKTIELTPLDCNQIVNGTILDSKTKLPLNNSAVSILENNSEIKNITTDNSGNFSFKINCESNFKIVAKNPEYNSNEISFNSDKSRDATISKTIELTPLDCNQIVNGTILDSKTKLPLNNSAVSILENNSEIKNITTDNSGNFSFKINCESNFKIVAKNPEYNSNEISFNSDKSRDATISKTIELTPLDCNQIVNGTILDSKTKLPLNSSAISILENNSEIKNITTDNSGNFSFKINCESNFKIVAKNSEYNSNEIEFDTDKSRDTIISKTIELTPLDCNQVLNGTVLDSKTKLPLNSSAISILENNSEIKNITTDNSGNFSFKINCESNFKIVAKNSEYNSNEIEFDTDKSRDTLISKTIELTPLDCNQVLNGTVLDKDTKLPLTNTSISIFENGKEIENTSTNNSGAFSFDVNCSKNYNITADNGLYEVDFKKITTNKTRNTVSSLTFNLSKKVCGQTVTGIIRDKITKKPLSNSNVTLSQNNKVLETYTVGEDGIYEFPLKCSSTYKLAVFKNNNLESFRLKTVTQNGRVLKLNIDIEPLVCIQHINGVLRENISNNPIPNANITLKSATGTVKELITDSNGNFYFEINCDNNYEIIAEKINYTKATKNIISTKISAYPHNVELKLEPIIKFKDQNGIRYIETKPINFELDEFEIIDDAKIELNKVVFNMNQNPNIKIEVNYHTDSRGPDEYNLQLTINRANSTKDYLVSKGIDPLRIKANGFGETKLLNKCKNDVKCTESEHSINRRTEFIVKK